MSASTIVIVNPQARGGWPARRWPLIEPELRAALGPLTLRTTTRVGEGTQLAKAAALAGARSASVASRMEDVHRMTLRRSQGTIC